MINLLAEWFLITNKSWSVACKLACLNCRYATLITIFALVICKSLKCWSSISFSRMSMALTACLAVLTSNQLISVSLWHTDRNRHKRKTRVL